ncbi:ATP synthase subunit e, mitochondrial-like [Ornithodoros turicata]|uniref:ATP synthase F(0) complex subunit e, mitochondrial n=1 Tax=Ornithodoros turicata TaxID=34597 RepID=A0A2R5LDP9_9ACAR
MVELAPPVAVSPFIRACRWGAFAAGVLYGAYNLKRLTKKEAVRREVEAKHQASIAAKKQEEKLRAQREELLVLAKETGTPVPPGF